jgi:hypothetical protein
MCRQSSIQIRAAAANDCSQTLDLATCALPAHPNTHLMHTSSTALTMSAADVEVYFLLGAGNAVVS